jgi:sulfoxide reductase heme-binding subunit YedZ
MPPKSTGPSYLMATKAMLWVLGLAPLVRLLAAGFWGAWGGLGANPVEFVTRSTGTWTLVCLCVTLAITPLRRISGQAWLIRVRRLCGLFTFFYGTLHALTYFWFDQYFEVAAILRDIVKRPFVTMGFAAFVLMLPLALTSTDAMIRRLGRRWGRLHRLIYVVAVAAILHYAWHKSGKNDYSEVAVYAAVMAMLLGWRVAVRLRRPRVPVTGQQ